MNTTNIPEHKPSFIHEDDWSLITAWMKTRPKHSDDVCVNRSARWTYELTDNGMFTSVKVRDNADGEKFTVPLDFENF